MIKTLICKSEVDLIELYYAEDLKIHLLAITDFGHGMSVDFRIVPGSAVQHIVQNINDKEFCSELSRHRTKYKPFKFDR